MAARRLLRGFPSPFSLRVAALASALATALLAGCTAAPPPPPPNLANADAGNAAQWYRQAAAAGAKVLAIDPAQSLVAVTVRRGGPLARFGHDHVVASRDITGFAAPAAGRADFSFRLDQMTVDEAALRREANLDTQPSPEAIAGTRTNMLTRVLEAERFPLVILQARQLGGHLASQPLQLSITLHGVTRTLAAPARIDTTPGGLAASGTLQLRQSDFGITPMSVMGGAMTVQDTMELRYRIVALSVLADPRTGLPHLRAAGDPGVDDGGAPRRQVQPQLRAPPQDIKRAGRPFVRHQVVGLRRIQPRHDCRTQVG
jgi:hypothetical protein